MAFSVESAATVEASGVEFSAAPNVEVTAGTGTKIIVTATDTVNADQFSLTFASITDALAYSSAILEYALTIA